MLPSRAIIHIDTAQHTINDGAMIMNDVVYDSQYTVTAVEKTTAPEGMGGDNWYRYVIKKGRSVVECKKPGTLKAVTEHAKGVAELINSRNSRGGQKKS